MKLWQLDEENDTVTSEIQLLKRIVGEHDIGLLENQNLESGKKVIVVNGELTGLEGTIIDINNKKEFVVNLKTIGADILVRIDQKHLQHVF